MSDHSSIEWTDATWNPVTGCTEVSPGCGLPRWEGDKPGQCYAKTFAERWRGTPGHHFENGFDVQLRPERLDQPLKWRKPRRIFVNSMSDLFHKHVPEEFIARVWTVMANTPQHTYQILTKRHHRMLSIVRRIAWRTPTTEERQRGVRGSVAYIQQDEQLNEHLGAPRVLPNVWLGVSVEDQQRADMRIPRLLATPAAVRFLSCEPLLGPIDLRRMTKRFGSHLDCLTGDITAAADGTICGTAPGVIDWVIAGGESGPGARPMHPDWARGLRDQCVDAGVPFLFKQWGAWCPPHPSHGQSIFGHVTNDDACQVVNVDGKLRGRPWGGWGLDLPEAIVMRRYPKGKAGRELDGRTWDEYPAAATAGAA
ncbi:phage Gp37/Gp68 family protein [Nonomuraea sp. NPDC023979]|uniref:DUF5131 family protein n=1 Tax=Nonomuraea sp. NPDC023979 TaxID=3154796 RepID=UPI0033CA6788